MSDDKKKTDTEKPLPPSNRDPLYEMQGPVCPEDEHDMQFVGVNSYGTMRKCIKCGMTDFMD